MRAFALVSALAAAAFAQDSSSSVDAFPQTSYLQQTNSLGVVTGMPAAASSIPDQPAAVSSMPLVVTSLPPGASIPAQYSGIHTVVIPLGNNSTTQVVVSASNSTTIVYGAPNSATGSAAHTTGGTGKPTGTGPQPTGSDASGTASGTQGSSTPGAAANVQVASGFLGAALLAAFL